MNHRVIRKQPNSRMCLVCGLRNPHGLHTAFYELDNNELVAVFTAHEGLQSYPGRLHGGIRRNSLHASRNLSRLTSNSESSAAPQMTQDASSRGPAKSSSQTARLPPQGLAST